MKTIIEANISEIRTLTQRYGLQRAYAFGSAVKKTKAEAIDVDFGCFFP
jgi:predicted nucleotidyltransferase